MAPAARMCLALPLRSTSSRSTTRVATLAAARALHTHPAQPARVVPVYGTGPPPEPPQPSAEFAPSEDPAVREERIARRRRQAELLKRAGDIKAPRQQQESAGGKGKTATSDSGLKRRFWKDVHVREVNGALEIHLDARPLRHPTTKAIIRLPTSKPYLAHALALEWDSLVSASQATRQHLIPLTSLTCRALDIASDDATSTTTATPNGAPHGAIRTSIAQTLLRYLDTDSLLCFSPPPPAGSHDPLLDGTPLHEQQHQAYTSTTSYLTTHLWPGIQIVPVLDEATSILPRQQPPGTREAVHAWILSLTPFELAGLERATLAGKSLLAAARLVGEWSEDAHGVHHHNPHNGNGVGKTEEKTQGKKKFGVEEAARAVSLEVDWQTSRWGEVEDTHDVEREDLRRQLGSVVLLVTGSGRRGDGSKSS